MRILRIPPDGDPYSRAICPWPFIHSAEALAAGLTTAAAQKALNKLNQQGIQVRTIKDLIFNGDSRKLFWNGSLTFSTDDVKWFLNQIKETPNTSEIISLLNAQPTKENIRKFIQSGFDVMWGNFETKSDNHGYEEGKNLLTNMAENAVQFRREYIKKNLVCGIYFIGEGHIKSWAEQFEDTEII